MLLATAMPIRDYMNRIVFGDPGGLLSKSWRNS